MSLSLVVLLLVPSLIRSFVYLDVRSYARSLVRSFVCSFACSFSLTFLQFVWSFFVQVPSCLFCSALLMFRFRSIFRTQFNYFKVTQKKHKQSVICSSSKWLKRFICFLSESEHIWFKYFDIFSYFLYCVWCICARKDLIFFFLNKNWYFFIWFDWLYFNNAIMQFIDFPAKTSRLAH